jgi:hypothetical protein
VRRIALSGLVAVAALLGGVIPATAATATPSAGTRVSPFSPAAALSAVTRAWLRPQASGATVAIIGTAISCGATTSCLVVGSTVNSSSGNSFPFAKAWNGTAWKPVTLHLPKGIAASGSALTQVACKSATNCVVLGMNLSGSMTVSIRPFTLTWNGTTLSPAAAPVLPSGIAAGYLVGLSCLTLHYCVGDGFGLTKSDVGHAFIETWNGKSWSLKFVWNASAKTLLELSGISCVSPSYCVVSGAGVPLKSLAPVPYLGLWNGKTLTKTPVPVPPGIKNSTIDGVSCTSTVNCAATGNSGSTSAPVSITAFAENWNGKVWTATRLPWPTGTGISLLGGVSCTSSGSAGRHCLATGASGTVNGGGAAAVTWDGKTWSLTKVPAPAAGNFSELTAVSCVSAVSCFAAGVIGPTNASSARPLAGFWNGSAWKLATT